jgi:hypothetical protein
MPEDTLVYFSKIIPNLVGNFAMPTAIKRRLSISYSEQSLKEKADDLQHLCAPSIFKYTSSA